MNKLFLFALIASLLIAFVAAQPVVEKGEVHVESLASLREKRAVSCQSVASQPKKPSTFNEACRAHCVLNGKRGGSCSGGTCSCY